MEEYLATRKDYDEDNQRVYQVKRQPDDKVVMLSFVGG